MSGNATARLPLKPLLGYTAGHMNAELFESGFEVGTYIENLRNYRSFVRGLTAEATADPQHIEQLSTAAGSLAQPVRISVMTEDWCGDSACNIPILDSLCQGAGISLRIFRGSETPQLEKRYHADGVDHIPVVSVWNGDFEEAARWIECPAAVEEQKDAWKADHPEFMDLYRRREKDKEAAKQFATLYRTFLEEMGRWYKEGMWSETTREIVEAVAR